MTLPGRQGGRRTTACELFRADAECGGRVDADERANDGARAEETRKRAHVACSTTGRLVGDGVRGGGDENMDAWIVYRAARA